jgi:hypothetical protein
MTRKLLHVYENAGSEQATSMSALVHAAPLLEQARPRGRPDISARG